MSRLGTLIAAIALAVLAVGAALAPLETSTFTRALSARYSPVTPQEAGYAEQTRRFVIVSDAQARATIERVMDPSAISHLDDVRRVIRVANLVTLLLLVMAAAWAVVGARAGWLCSMARALRISAIILAGFVALALLVALTNFDAFFAAFHSLFFAAGTWTFPSDSLLIRLFPEQFWSSAGGAWGGTILLIAAAYWALSMALKRREQRQETL